MCGARIMLPQFCVPHGHSLTARSSNLDETTRTDLIRTCGNAYRALLRAGVVSPRDRPMHLAPASALFEAAKDGRATISAVFGGQVRFPCLHWLCAHVCRRPSCNSLTCTDTVACSPVFS